jgi:hypothetical protein
MAVPKFADTESWQQAEMLMQPVFIRVIDNIRKELEQSSWQGTYREEIVWAEGVSPQTQEKVLALRNQLPTADPSEAPQIEAVLAKLPQPHPVYQLCLKHNDQQVVVDLWQLCYRICFKNYSPLLSMGDRIPVEIDSSLIDEFGEVDWNRLDEKAKRIIEQIFHSLPSSK